MLIDKIEMVNLEDSMTWMTYRWDERAADGENFERT